MNLSKLLLAVPVLALSICLVGCSPGADSTVIEQEQLSEEEVAKMDEDYDAQYAEEAAAYEEMDDSGQ